MGKESIAIHTNFSLAHQIKWAKALQDGFIKHGYKSEITAGKTTGADIHVVQGPWYCFKQLRYEPRVIYLDRCFFGDTEFYCSLGWLRPDGSRDFLNENSPPGRFHGEVLPWKQEERNALILCDFGDKPNHLIQQARHRFGAYAIRHHPAEGFTQPPLQEHFDWADVVLGHSTTTLVDAVLHGIPVICSDARHVIAPVSVLAGKLFRGDRTQWLNDLSYTQWHLHELRDGTAWEHLSRALQ